MVFQTMERDFIIFSPVGHTRKEKKKTNFSKGGVQAAAAFLDKALTEYCRERNEVHGCLIILPDILEVSLQGARSSWEPHSWKLRQKI